MTTTGWHHTPESKAKLSAALRGKPGPVTRGFRGKHHSPASRELLRERAFAAIRDGRHASDQLRGSKRDDQKDMLRRVNLGNRNVRDARVKGDCVYCGDPATTYDHRTPRSRGGTDDPENVVLACLACNSSKGPRPITDWIESLQRLARTGERAQRKLARLSERGFR